LPSFNRRKAEEFADWMGLASNDFVHGLSSGQEARLQLILCLARDTRLILLDEPFSGIDLISREQIIEAIIATTIERRQTLILCTHDIHETEGLFDHVVFMKQGKVVLSGDTEQLREQQGSMESIYRGLFR